MPNEPKLEWGPWTSDTSNSEILADLVALEKKCAEATVTPYATGEQVIAELHAAHDKKVDETYGPRCGKPATDFWSHYGSRCPDHRPTRGRDFRGECAPTDLCGFRVKKEEQAAKLGDALNEYRRAVGEMQHTTPTIMQGQATFLDKCRANRKVQVERDHHPDGSIAHTVTGPTEWEHDPEEPAYDWVGYDEARKMRPGLADFIQAAIVVDDPRDVELTAEQSAALTDWWKKTMAPRIARAVEKTAAQVCMPTSIILPDNPEEHVQFISPKKAIFEAVAKAWQKTYEELWNSTRLVPWTPPEPELPKEEPTAYKIRTWADSHPGERMPVAHVLHAAEELPIGRRPCYYCGQARLAVRFTPNNTPVCDRHERTS